MDNKMALQLLNRRSLRFIWTDVTKIDMNITKFLSLLLKFNYKWFPNDQPGLNLTETEKEGFIQECSESIDPVDEITAYIIIEIIKDLFDEELSRLEECSEKDSESGIPWFSLACQIFSQSSTLGDSRISSPSTSTVAIASSIPPSSVLNLKMTYASTPTTDSSSSTPNVQQFSWTTLPPNYGKPPFYQKKHLANPSPKAVYHNGFFSENVAPQYDFPILYPVCILPQFSLGRPVCILPQFSLGRLRGSGFSCTQNENVTLFDNSMPVDLSSSDRINSYRLDNRPSNRTNSYHPYNQQSDRTNSNRPDNRHNQMIKQGRNSSQSDTSITSIEPTATGFIRIQHSIVKEYENSTSNFFSRESFRSSTTETTSTVFRDIPSTSSFSTISRPTLTNIGHSSFREASTPSARVSISQEYRDSTTPSSINSLPGKRLTNNNQSSFHEASTPSSRVSISQEYRDSTTPNPINPINSKNSRSSFHGASTPLSSKVCISQEYRDSTTPSPINSLPEPRLTNNNQSSFREASTPLSSRVSISQANRNSTTPNPINSLPRQTVTNNNQSSFHEASTPSSRISISQEYRDFTTPSSINSLIRSTLTNIGHSSFREASTPLSSRVSISQADRDSLYD